MNCALDSGVMIAFLDGEPGADVAEEVLTEPGCICYAHIFNLTEIYYIYFRRGGKTLAESTIQDLLELDIVFRDDNDEVFWKEAASFKGRHAMSLPDGFCLTLARRLGGTVVTTDHGEFDPLVPFGYCPILFIR